MGASETPEALNRVNGFSIVFRGPIVIAATNVVGILYHAASLLETAVHVEVHMTAGMQYSPLQYICMDHIDELSIFLVQFGLWRGCHEHGFGGVQSGYSLQFAAPDEIRNHSGGLPTQTETNDVYVIKFYFLILDQEVQ